MAMDSLDSLFTTDFGERISFNTEALLEPRCMVNDPIKRYGGEVTDEMGPHTVYLVPDPADLQGRKDTQPPFNTFTRMYIQDSACRKKLPKLKDHWVHKLKNFDEQFDPQEVMNGYLTWEDCTKEMSCSTSGLTPVTAVVCSDDDGAAGGSTAPSLPSPATPEPPRLSKGIPSHSEGQTEASTRLPRTSEPLTSLPHISNETPCSTSGLTPVTAVVCSDDDGAAGGSTAPLLPSPATPEPPRLSKGIPSHSEGQTEASTRLPRTSEPLTSLPHITNETPCSTSGLPPVTVSDDDIFNSADSSTDKPRCVNRKGRVAYTSIEKLKILAYIHKEKLHDKVNGNIIWKKMEEEEVCPGRTWQSMKEHFRKSLSHQLDKFPKHLTDVFSHPSKQHGFYTRPAPPLPEQQSSSSSDWNIDMENVPTDERHDGVKHTKAEDGCGRSFAQRITRDERTISGSTEEGTHKSPSYFSQQKKMKESVKGSNYFVPFSAQTDERRENEDQNTQVTTPAPQQVRGEGGRECNMEGADQTAQANTQVTTPAPQQVRTEGGREREIREGADQTSWVCTQKENHRESVKESRHFILPPVLTEEKEESENSSSPVIVPVPDRNRTEEEGREKQESRDDNENTSSYMLHSDTEDVDMELLLNESKKAELSKSHLNTGADEVNVCETKEGELDRVSPSILTSSDAFFMDMHSVLQESQGFSVYHLDPLSGEKEKEDIRSGKNIKGKYLRDEQQEPDSSIEILEEPEGWSKRDKRAQSRHLKSSQSSTNQKDSFSTLSTQNDQETLLAEDNEDDLLPEEIFQTSRYLTSSIPDCAHNALSAEATMEELYKAVEPLPGPSDAISSSQDFICSTNIFQHDKSAAPPSRPTLLQGSNKVNKESKERKEDIEESQGKETSDMMEDCVRSATNDTTTQEELEKARQPLSTSLRKRPGQKKEQETQDEDRVEQDEEIRKIQEVEELEVEATEEEEETFLVGKDGEELDDVGKVDENEEAEKVNKESEDKKDKKEAEEIPVSEVSDSSKHSTRSLIQDCEIIAINDKTIHGKFQTAVHSLSTLSRERQGQEEELEYQDQALENEDGEQGEGQEMEEGESAEDEEEEVVVEDRRVVKEFNDDEEEEKQEVEKVSRGTEERKDEGEEDESSEGDISDCSKRSTSSMIREAGRSALSDEAILEEYQESVHPLSPLARKKQEQKKKQENQEQELENKDGEEQVEEIEEVFEVDAAEEEEEIVEKRTDGGGSNDYDEEEDEVEVGRRSEERKDEEEENKIADSEISDYSRDSASSMIEEHVKRAVKGKAIQRDLQQAPHPSSTPVRRRRQGQEKEQGNQELEYEEEQGEEILLDKEMEEALEVEGALEEDAIIVNEVEEESNDDAGVEEERHDEEEFEVRKRKQERSKQRSLYFSSRLPMKRRRMELCHTSSHITNDGPSTSRAEPRQHTREEPAPSESRFYSSRSLTCSRKSTDHSTRQRQTAGSYTVMEDLTIINYIVRENAYDRVGGRALWQEMATNLPTARTWQSLKERFRKRIVTNLHVYTAHGLGKKTIQKLEGKTTIDTGYGKMQNQRQHQEEALLLQHPTAQSGGSCRQARRTKGLNSSESEDKRTFDPQHRRSRMESRSCSEKNISNYKHGRRTKELSSSESEDERTFNTQQRRSRMESRSCSEKNITNYKHSRRTRQVGSSESEDERTFDSQQRRSKMESRTCSEKNITNYKHGRRTEGLYSSESEDERTFDPQQRRSRMESSSCREKYLTNKGNSYFKVKRHKKFSQQTESEDSDSEESFLAESSQSSSAGQPCHAKGKHQHQGHAKMKRSGATKRRKKVTPAMSDHSQPKRGQNSVAITSKFEEYKDWKFKVLQEALGKAPHAHSKSQRSDAGSSFYSPPSSRHGMHHPLRKKCRLLDPEEMCMSPPKTPISHSSKDLSRNLLDQQKKHQRRGSTVNTKTQGQHKLQTVAERSDACDGSDNQDSVRKDSEASGTTSKHISLLESDMDESDQGTLPDLNFSIAASPHQSKVHSTEEKEKEDISQEEEDESSGGSIALFEL